MGKESKSSPLTILFVLSISALLAYFVLVPDLSGKYRKSPMPKVLTNVKQASTALLIEAHKSEGKFPTFQSQKDLQTHLLTTTKLNPETFTYGSKDHKVDIQINPNLSGVNLKDIPTPDQTILAYTPYANNRFSEVQYLVTYIDNSSKIIPASEWTQESQSLNLPQPQVTNTLLTTK